MSTHGTPSQLSVWCPTQTPLQLSVCLSDVQHRHHYSCLSDVQHRHYFSCLISNMGHPLRLSNHYWVKPDSRWWLINKPIYNSNMIIRMCTGGSLDVTYIVGGREPGAAYWKGIGISTAVCTPCENAWMIPWVFEMSPSNTVAMCTSFLAQKKGLEEAWYSRPSLIL